MVQVERVARVRRTKRDLRRAILGLVQASGVVAVGLIAPNVPAALKKLGMTPTGPNDTGSINRARTSLIKARLLERDGDGYVRLTPAGEHLLALQTQKVGVAKPRRWDERWRILIFDIPESKKSLRERLRHSLHAVGFVRLQDSVWAFPYPCEEFVALLKADLRIGKDMLYLIVENMEGDTELRKRFELR